MKKTKNPHIYCVIVAHIQICAPSPKKVAYNKQVLTPTVWVSETCILQANLLGDGAQIQKCAMTVPSIWGFFVFFTQTDFYTPKTVRSRGPEASKPILGGCQKPAYCKPLYWAMGHKSKNVRRPFHRYEDSLSFSHRPIFILQKLCAVEGEKRQNPFWGVNPLVIKGDPNFFFFFFFTFW